MWVWVGDAWQCVRARVPACLLIHTEVVCAPGSVCEYVSACECLALLPVPPAAALCLPRTLRALFGTSGRRLTPHKSFKHLSLMPAVINKVIH